MGIIGAVKNMSFFMGAREEEEEGEKNGLQNIPIKTSPIIFCEKIVNKYRMTIKSDHLLV